MKKYIFFILTTLIFNGLLFTLTAQDIVLPTPDKEGGMPLMQALNERHTTRSFTNERLTPQQLSNLLWAGWGINRTDIIKRTAPSSMNHQEIDIYVALPEGLYLYIAESHILKMRNNKDLRSLTGSQSFVAGAALNIIYVADLAKKGKKLNDEILDRDLLSSWANTGFIAQNIYLYCASANLGCVVRGSVSNEKLATGMGLRLNQRITLAQTVGVPKKD
jgi:nitroreductase